MTALRVVVADDHPLFREGLESLLTDLGAEVVASVADGAAAIDAVRQLDPDIVFMDLRMPGITGEKATAQISLTHPRTAVLVLTMSDDAASLHAALRAGARGYLLKEASKEDISRALTAVTNGELVIGRGAAAAVRSVLTQANSRPYPQLTDREFDILRLMATGADNASIGRSLFLAEKTVRNRVTSVLSKMNVRTRAEAIAAARDAGVPSATRS